MALRRTFVDSHINGEVARLTSQWNPHRKFWPARLFHHAPLENAVSILQAGVIRSRNDPANPHPRDVASQAVVHTREEAHEFVRLYFRPKTPTQYHIEGIRKQGECPYGENTHAPILVMFALDARQVLLQPGVHFSDCNMQLGHALYGDTEEFFETIPFTKVFSEGGSGGDRSIIDARSAEVLAASPLNLNQCLREVYFRSEPERDTVSYMLGQRANQWANKFYVSDALRVFEKRFTFVQQVALTSRGLTFLLNPRADLQQIHVEASVSSSDGRIVQLFESEQLDARPSANKEWIYKYKFPDGEYLVEMKLEGHLAFRAKIPLTSVLF